jgi:hypothetical protein
MSVLGGWILLPSRNIRGNTLFETEIDSCMLAPSGMTISLFSGDAGPMGSFWYSVTERAPGSPFRHQIFYAYASQIFERVRCRQGDTLDIIGPNSTRSMPLAEIGASLRKKPLLFVRDSIVAAAPPPQWQSIDWWGCVLLAIGCSGLVLTSTPRFWSAATGYCGRYIARQMETLSRGWPND